MLRSLLFLLMIPLAGCYGVVGQGTFSGTDVVVIGEQHGDPRHHAYQAELTGEIAPSALVFEQFTPEQASILMDARADGRPLAEEADRLDWANSGWPDLELYTAIIDAAPAGTAIYEAVAPAGSVRAAFSSGAAEVFGAEAGRYGLTEALPDDEQAMRETLQFTAHCEAMPMEMMGGMVEAQRFRDAAFARTVLTALEETGGPVVLITGNGHARTDWGVPAVIARAAPGVQVRAIGQVPASDPTPFDIRVERDAMDMETDPCDALRQAG